jgi:hypothetical protein
MLRIEPRLAFINGVLLANRVLIFRSQLLAVYVLLVHNCGECRIGFLSNGEKSSYEDNLMKLAKLFSFMFYSDPTNYAHLYFFINATIVFLSRNLLSLYFTTDLDISKSRH